MHGTLGFKCTLAGEYLYSQTNAQEISVMYVFYFACVVRYVYFCTGHVNKQTLQLVYSNIHA